MFRAEVSWSRGPLSLPVSGLHAEGPEALHGALCCSRELISTFGGTQLAQRWTLNPETTQRGRATWTCTHSLTMNTGERVERLLSVRG